MNTQDTEQTDATGDVERCLTCQAPVVPIAYGFPGPEMFEVAERGEIVCEWRPDLTDTFEMFAIFIRAEGVVKPWPADSSTPRYNHRYLAIDGWDYWIMDGTIEDTEVINRALLDDVWQ